MYNILIFLIFTVLFFVIIDINKKHSRQNKDSSEDYDGNGEFNYKGKGHSQERIDILLSRIDWLAKNSENKSLYTTAYIISFPILLAVIVILYAYSYYIVSVWEIIIILASTFIITFSILNLFNFHTERYSNYYIRRNLNYIANQLKIDLFEPPIPNKNIKLPHRTVIQDFLIR